MKKGAVDMDRIKSWTVDIGLRLKRRDEEVRKWEKRWFLDGL